VKFGRTVIGGIIKLFKAVESKDNTGWVIHVVNGIKNIIMSHLKHSINKHKNIDNKERMIA